jgi:two-component system response regulator FixJ
MFVRNAGRARATPHAAPPSNVAESKPRPHPGALPHPGGGACPDTVALSPMTESSATAPPRVFIVDDDDAMRAALHRLFKSSGFEVTTFASAQALLDAGDLPYPGVLLLDVLMPGMTGLELQEILVARGAAPPIVFLTASHSVPMAVAAMQRGAVDFVEKPFENDDLVARVRAAFGRVAPPEDHARRADYERKVATLTPREREVMTLVVTGKTNKEIARELHVSPRTIEVHRFRVMDKMEAPSLAALVGMVLAHGGR